MKVRFTQAGKVQGNKTAAYGHAVDDAGKNIEGATVTICGGPSAPFIMNLDCDTVYELSATPTEINAPKKGE